MSTEQEYDAQTDMVDDQETESGPGPYPEPIPQHMNQQANPGQQQQHQHQQQQHGHDAGQYPSMTQLLDPYDPMLDLDPFGLSASMQFPTSFSLYVPDTSPNDYDCESGVARH